LLQSNRLSYFDSEDSEGEIWQDFWVPDPDYSSRGPHDVPPLVLRPKAESLFWQKLNRGEIAWTEHTYFTDLTTSPPEPTRSDGKPASPKRKRSFDETAKSLLAFFHDRLKVHLRDEGIRHDVIDAVLAMPGSDDLTLVVKRAEALSAFLKTDDGTNLLQGFKRANNILTQAEEKDGVEYSYGADPKFAEGPEETALFTALDEAEAALKPAMEAEDFAAAMTAMARAMVEHLTSRYAPCKGELIALDSMAVSLPITQNHQCVKMNRNTAGGGVLWEYRIQSRRGTCPVRILRTMAGAWMDANFISASNRRGPVRHNRRLSGSLARYAREVSLTSAPWR
jgi:hypothetical protein